MINDDIIKLASNTSNVGLKNEYSHKASLKNSICGDKITLEIVVNKKNINSMKYETESCVYCEASASLLSKKICNLDTKNISANFTNLKEFQNKKSLKYQKIFSV